MLSDDQIRTAWATCKWQDLDVLAHNFPEQMRFRFAHAVEEALRAQADAGQWNGLSDDEKDQFVGSLVEYGTKFVAPLYAVVENIEKALMEKNRAQADAQPLFYVADDLTPEMVGEGRRVFVSAESFAGCSQALFIHPAPEAAQAGLMEAIAICQQEGDEWDSDNVQLTKNYAHACRDRIAQLLTRSAATVAEPSNTATNGDDSMPKRGTLAWLIRLLQQLQVHGTASEAKVYINDPTFGRVEVGGALYGIADVELTPNDDDEEAAQQQAEPSECSACDGTGLLQHLSGDPQDAINCFVCALQAEPVGDERAKCQHCHGLGIAAIIGRTEVTCAACDGVGYWHGEESGYGDIDCDACGGTGKQTPADTEAVARALCESVAKRSDRTAGELWTEYRSEFMDDAKAALLAAQSGQRAGVPDGYVLVPVEPTDEMLNAGAICHHLSDTWSQMIAAAPTPAAQGGDSHD